jgi:hypothetical protein
MFEKIGVAAEKVATNVSESRRSFLVRVGQAALGVTGVVAGLLALPSEALANQGFTHGCEVVNTRLTGACIDNRRGNCFVCIGGCVAGLRAPLSVPLCRSRIDPTRSCTCF